MHIVGRRLSDTALRRALREQRNAVDDAYLVDEHRSPVRPRPRRFEAHDATTRMLIAQRRELEDLPHNERVLQLLEHWRWLDAMKGAEDKQHWLEPLIRGVQRAPQRHQADIVFLLTIFEPLRGSVAKALRSACHGGQEISKLSALNRTEARRINEIDRQDFDSALALAVLKAIYAYPLPVPRRLFPWFKETIAHRALDQVRGSLLEQLPGCFSPEEADALTNALHGFDAFTPPEGRSSAGLNEWRRRIDVRDAFDAAREYAALHRFRGLCERAVGRLAPRQSQVIEHVFLASGSPDELARHRGVARSTIDNHKAQALGRLQADDAFFVGLHALGRVRDQARIQALRRKYPDGRLPDGRRHVVIERA